MEYLYLINRIYLEIRFFFFFGLLNDCFVYVIVVVFFGEEFLERLFEYFFLKEVIFYCYYLKILLLYLNIVI